MVLRSFGITTCNLQVLTELSGTTSIWTVDLAYLLLKFPVSFSFVTVTVGANPNYSGETFYKCRSISGEEISFLILSGKYIAIALVDQYKLMGSIQSWPENLSASSFFVSNSGYTGHYVVICGYATDANEFEIRDPASSRKDERVSSKCLEKARKRFGTDEDLLLISLEKSERQNCPSVQLPPDVNIEL